MWQYIASKVVTSGEPKRGPRLAQLEFLKRTRDTGHSLEFGMSETRGVLAVYVYRHIYNLRVYMYSVYYLYVCIVSLYRLCVYIYVLYELRVYMYTL